LNFEHLGYRPVSLKTFQYPHAPTHFQQFFLVQVVDIFSKLCYIMDMVYLDEEAMFKSKVSKLADLKGLIFRSLNPGGQNSALPGGRKVL
jgi:hypothetical protein